MQQNTRSDRACLAFRTMVSETDWSFHFMTKTDKSCLRAKKKQWQVEYLL